MWFVVDGLTGSLWYCDGALVETLAVLDKIYGKDAEGYASPRVRPCLPCLPRGETGQGSELRLCPQPLGPVPGHQ